MWIAMGYLNDYTIKSMNEWMISYLRNDWQSQDTTHNQWSVNQ